MDTQLPADVREHLADLVKASKDDWAGEDGALERLEALWAKKDKLFEEQIALLGFESVDSLTADDERGLLLLTYSGSLVSLGCGARRWLEYASIKLRADVPDILRADGASLAEDLAIGGPAAFEGGPVKRTSALYRIVVCPEGLGVQEQEKRVREATIFLTNSFVHLNRDLTAADEAVPDQFDKKAVVAYLAGKNGLTQKSVREVLEDYAVLLETGMLLGRTVALGRLGRFSLNLKPARKARIGRNPATGEEITIPAKEAQLAPSFKFSARVKERASGLPLPEGTLDDE